MSISETVQKRHLTARHANLLHVVALTALIVWNRILLLYAGTFVVFRLVNVSPNEIPSASSRVTFASFSSSMPTIYTDSLRSTTNFSKRSPKWNDTVSGASPDERSASCLARN